MRLYLYASNNYLKENSFHLLNKKAYFPYLNNSDNISNIVPMMKKITKSYWRTKES